MESFLIQILEFCIDCSSAGSKTNRLSFYTGGISPMKGRVLLFSAAVILFATESGLAQAAGQRGQRGRPPAGPAPRQADGRVTLGPLPGQLGVWLPGAG